LLPHLGERVVYVGNIVGPYVYTKSWDDSCDHLHRRRVEWFKDIGWDYLSEKLRNTLSTPATLRNLDDYVYEIEFHLISKRY
jgi:predicted Mrr-cat superfamily restriction endonuclease